MKLKNKQLICPPYTIKVTEITRQIKNYVCGCVYVDVDVGACG